jgi:hypothetical protein
MTQYVKTDTTGKPNSFGFLKVCHKVHGLAAPEPNREIWEEPSGRLVVLPKGARIARRSGQLYVDAEEA